MRRPPTAGRTPPSTDPASMMRAVASMSTASRGTPKRGIILASAAVLPLVAMRTRFMRSSTASKATPEVVSSGRRAVFQRQSSANEYWP
jgi:hypothetical protein